MVSSKVFRFYVKFVVEPNKLPHSYEEHVKQFFEKCHDETEHYTVEMDVAKKVDVQNKYSENIYQINVSIRYLDVNSDSKLSKNVSEIIRKWCEIQSTEFSCWLILADRLQFPEEYRYDSILKAGAIAFGTLPNMGSFVRHFQYVAKRKDTELMCSFYHNRKCMKLSFLPLHAPNCAEPKISYIFDVRYSSIKRIIVNTADKAATDFFFQVHHPPIVYSKLKEEKDEDVFSTRANDFCEPSDIQLHPEEYSRPLQFGCRCSNSVCSITKIGQYPIFKVAICDKYRARYVIQRLSEKCGKKIEICYGQFELKKLLFTPEMFAFMGFNYFLPNRNGRYFNCHYSWKSIFCRSVVVRDQVFLQKEKDTNFLNVIKRKILLYLSKNEPALVEAFFAIAAFASKNLFFSFQHTLDSYYKAFCDSEPSQDLPSGMCLVRRVILTPSRMILTPPLEQFDNRVIRQFGAEYMLRLSVQDDNFSNLTFGCHLHANKFEFMHCVVGEKLLSGLTIGNRCYEILAASNSQLRDHGLWLYAKDDNKKSASDIRSWLGDFSKIRNVAKYMARIGQCFSQSELAVQIAVNAKEEIPLEEKISKNGRYTFSDGIGTISSSLAKEIRVALDPKSSYEPSAFQIRFRGSKGVVVEDPDLKERRIGIRPSMTKFPCKNSNSIEIIKSSAPRKLFLNRPLITILEQLGVRSDVFLKLHKSMILYLMNSLIYEKEAAAVMSYFLPFNFPYVMLQDVGISLINEPFFRSLLICICKSAVEKLRLKGRIWISPEYGRNMLGVMDETGLLKYGQVFVQYSQDISPDCNTFKRLEGTVVVTKNPCMHPGDVQKLEAVDIPKLRHIKDCIVFPSQGKRPHPDEMAGSDLDGDEYVVIWHPELIFPRANYPPMHYPNHETEEMPFQIEVKQMVTFFCKYILNDNIGSFGNAHLSWADQHPKGIFSNVCMRIAEKYPFVLDFAKTGKHELLAPDERANRYPDFMEKGNVSNSYYSTKSLGLLYRSTRQLETYMSSVSTIPHSIQPDPYLQYPGWKKYEQRAEAYKATYQLRVESILKKFGSQSEAEALCGCMEGLPFDQSRNEKSNCTAVVRSYLKGVFERYRWIFLEDLSKEAFEHNLTSQEEKICKFQMASAWYMTSYKSNSSKLLSLPWVIADVLAEVRKECLMLQNVTIHNARNFELGFNQDAVIQSFFDAQNTEAVENSTCRCARNCKVLLQTWLVKTDLIRAADNVGCSHCLTRVITWCFNSSGKSCCCSEDCQCSTACSTTKLLILLLKFLVYNVEDVIGKCNGSCLGFISANLQSIALQALANLVLTGSLKNFGVESENDMEDINSIGLADFESEQVRIPVRDDSLKELLFERMDDVKDYLKKLSGVKEIFVETTQGARENWYLLISSIGRSFQHWNLQEIVLDRHFAGKIKTAMQS